MFVHNHVGVVGFGTYLPKHHMTAKEVSKATGGVWAEEAVIEKLGFVKKTIAGPEDGTQEMGYLAAKDCIVSTGVNPLDIDVIICIGEEWKEYPLTTSAMYIQHKLGAINAYGFDIAQRCCTAITAMKIAKDMMLSDESVNTVLICGGYRNEDFIDYKNSRVSFMFNLATGGGAVLLKKNYGKNELLETSIITDGSFARDVGVVYGGTLKPIDNGNLGEAYKSLDVMDVEGMKSRLNEKSTPNFLKVIRESLRKSGYSQEDIDYIAMIHFKYSAHKFILSELGVPESKSIYLKDYGHLGQIDQILSVKLALEQGKIKNGDIVVTVGAGIGYAWAANTIKWGEIYE
ncbi:3-oxoacyl-ACP synthase [Clostridium sp. MSJ-4]|uniref:3-oxoacyl-ACP synthase n=1 Tax=Clostridium simiarum TaxID=2841506 RepID=A0ABS6F334_9CLOT|nr:3-oxoacyl-ACP synthase [Clostridium simiarum]